MHTSMYNKFQDDYYKNKKNIERQSNGYKKDIIMTRIKKFPYMMPHHTNHVPLS